MGILYKTVVAIGLGLVTSLCAAGSVEDAIRKAIEPRLGVPAERITKSGYAGLYEVDTARGLVYTDSKGEFLLVNSLFIDSKTGANLTEKRMNELGAFKFVDLPLSDAIKTVRGNGSRVLVTLEDPNCGYCKRLMGELAKLDNVTIYTFLVPILSDDSLRKSRSIWCASNRGQTWQDYMLKNKALPENGDCDAPIERNLALYRKLRIQGTPAILFQSGDRFPGLVTADQIEQRLGGKK